MFHTAAPPDRARYSYVTHCAASPTGQLARFVTTGSWHNSELLRTHPIPAMVSDAHLTAASPHCADAAACGNAYLSLDEAHVVALWFRYTGGLARREGDGW